MLSDSYPVSSVLNFSVDFFNLARNAVCLAESEKILFAADQHNFLKGSRILPQEPRNLLARADAAPDNRRFLCFVIAVYGLFPLSAAACSGARSGTALIIQSAG